MSVRVIVMNKGNIRVREGRHYSKNHSPAGRSADCPI